MFNLNEIEEVEVSDNGDADKEQIIQSLAGAVDEVDVYKALVLVAIFQRDKVAKNSKIITATITKKEDVYQGRVGLVLKTGPLAFKNSKDVEFAGKEAKPGDWVFYVPANGVRMMVNGIECRLIEDVHIDGKVNDPYILL